VPSWTARRTLAWIAEDLAARGVQTPRLDGELLVARALSCDRLRLYMDLDRPLAPDELERIRGLVARRRRREPVAYILGQREFFGRPFEVTPAVLIPRPDTETLVERALALIEPQAAIRGLDLATGSGAIAISITAERPGISFDITDISEAALQVAERNAKTHEVLGRLAFYLGDLFSALHHPWRGPDAVTATSLQSEKLKTRAQGYDLITCNPPYIASGQWKTLPPEITQYEPPAALLGGEDGLTFYRRICDQMAEWVIQGGTVLLEVGDGQAAAVSSLLKNTGRFQTIRTHQDLRMVERVVEAKAN
jgi:release factor glutamine methyltransferase